MSNQSRKLAGILLIIMPTVLYGGISLLQFLINDPAYSANQLRQDLFRAGQARAGVLLVLSLTSLKYVDETTLTDSLKAIVRSFIPASAILLPAGFFFSVFDANATKPNGFINLAYAGAVLLAAGLVILGIGLVRSPDREEKH